MAKCLPAHKTRSAKRPSHSQHGEVPDGRFLTHHEVLPPTRKGEKGVFRAHRLVCDRLKVGIRDAEIILRDDMAVQDAVQQAISFNLGEIVDAPTPRSS